MLICQKGNYSAFENTSGQTNYYVQNAQGIVLKHFGFSTERGRALAKSRAQSFVWGLHAKDCMIANRELVSLGHCPTCGKGIKRNLSLAGWWQCEQFGAPQFRKNPDLPPCNWQCFTE